jgi:hypothetical protein
LIRGATSSLEEKFMKRRIFIALLVISVSIAAPAFAADALKKIRIASKGAGETLLPYLIPQRLGFYREEGLDVDVIVTRGTVTTQVVLSGAVDYSNGGSIPAMLGGARIKILLINTDKPAQHLVSSAKITNMKQLAGKTIAVSRYCCARCFRKTAWPWTACRCVLWASRRCAMARSWAAPWTPPWRRSAWLSQPRRKGFVSSLTAAIMSRH